MNYCATDTKKSLFARGALGPSDPAWVVIWFQVPIRNLKQTLSELLVGMDTQGRVYRHSEPIGFHDTRSFEL
jgi:hypothetical protein